jgi:chemotaxis protein histidine kinase CheA
MLPESLIETTPKADQIKQFNGQSFLHWRDQLVPVQPLSGLLEYWQFESNRLIRF